MRSPSATCTLVTDKAYIWDMLVVTVVAGENLVCDGDCRAMHGSSIFTSLSWLSLKEVTYWTALLGLMPDCLQYLLDVASDKGLFPRICILLLG